MYEMDWHRFFLTKDDVEKGGVQEVYHQFLPEMQSTSGFVGVRQKDGGVEIFVSSAVSGMHSSAAKLCRRKAVPCSAPDQGTLKSFKDYFDGQGKEI